jgi:cytochrome c2
MRTFLVAVGVVGVALAGVATGIWLQYKRIPASLMPSLVSLSRSVQDRILADPQVVQWKDIRSNLHVLQVAAIKISNVTATGGSVAEVGGNILIASPQGHFSYLDRRNELHSLDLDVPMNIEALRNHPLYKQPLMDVTEVRTHDLLAIETGRNTYELYASFNRFAGGCFEFVVSRISLEVGDRTLRPTSGWRDLWIAKPCVGPKDRGSLFVGSQSGGRMVQSSNDTILVAVGDHQFDGFYDSRAVAMDAATDLGKIIEINIKTGVSRHFAIGLRNPQGLAIGQGGRIWETEHGPQGGDEVNLIIDGRNYGWPVVTYGMAYGYPPKNWPSNPTPGAHDTYTRPRFAFVPSIGISNIIAPDPREFPNWSTSLVLCSLVGNKLFVLRTEGDDIAYAEPISLEGYRLRDIISLRDGRLAILTDRGSLLLVRNAEAHRGDVQVLEVRGLASLPRPSVEEAPPREGRSAEVRGRQYFAGMCGACHSLNGEITAGPPLNGVIGRQIAGVAGFGYSTALAGRRERWTEPLIASYITNPKVFAPGTSMGETGIWVGATEDIIAYLKTTREVEGR